MVNAESLIKERGKRQRMFFNKSITIDEEVAIGKVALAAQNSSVGSAMEADFIEKLKAGDAEAFDTLVNRYTSDIYALLFRITQDREEAGDLTQETFLRALKAIKKFRGEADIKTWLYRIAINNARNRFRWWKRRKREKTISIDQPLGMDEKPLSETFSGSGSSPEEDVLRREREKFLIKALQELSGIFREAVVLCDIEGFSYQEISVALDINIGTVKSRIARGREELRKKLADI